MSPLSVGLLLLAGASLVAGDAYLVLCTSSEAYAPWGSVNPSLCKDLEQGKVPIRPNNQTNQFEEEQASLRVPTWSWDTKTEISASATSLGANARASLGNFRVRYEGRMAPEVLMASMLGAQYSKVFLVEIKPGWIEASPIALWQLSKAYITSIDKVYSDQANLTWTLDLQFDQLTYWVWKPTATEGNATLYSSRACFSSTTNKACATTV